MEKDQYDKLVHAAQMSAAPIDFASLIEEGLLAKEGGWYRVLKTMDDLPEHARRKINKVEADDKGIKVTFASHKKMKKFLEEQDIPLEGND